MLILSIVNCQLSIVLAQDKTVFVSGVVVDADTGEPLPFVQIYFIKSSSQGSLNTQYGTTSDIDGNFSLSNPAGHTTVNFQMI